MKTYIDSYMEDYVYKQFMTSANMQEQADWQTYTLIPKINTVWRARVIEKNNEYVDLFPIASNGCYFDDFVITKTAFANLFNSQ